MSTIEKYQTGTTLTSMGSTCYDFPWLLASGETAINFTYDDGQGNAVEITTIKVESGSNTYTIGEGSAATTSRRRVSTSCQRTGITLVVRS